MCQNCSESLHSKGLFKLHTVRKSDDFEIRPQSKRTYKCPVHKQELNIYCKQDGKIVCSHCVVIDSHKSHECVSLEQRCNETRKEILSSAINVKKINAELMESNVLLQNLLESVKKKAKERQLDLDSFEAELIIAVKARFTELRDKVTKIELEKVNSLIFCYLNPLRQIVLQSIQISCWLVSKKTSYYWKQQNMHKIIMMNLLLYL